MENREYGEKNDYNFHREIPLAAIMFWSMWLNYDTTDGIQMEKRIQSTCKKMGVFPKGIILYAKHCGYKKLSSRPIKRFTPLLPLQLARLLYPHDFIGPKSEFVIKYRYRLHVLIALIRKDELDDRCNILPPL